MIIVDPQLEKLMPELTQQEYDLLKSNILKDGCRHPIVLWNNIVIDGHNRLKICEELSIDYSTESIDFDSIDDVKEWIFDNQMGRRNLKPDHISWLRGRCYQKEKKAAHRPLSKLSNKGDQNDHLKTAEKIAEKHGVGTATIRRDAKFAEAVETVKKVDPEIESKIIKGTAPPKREIIKQAKKIEPRKEIKQRPITSTKSTFNATNDNIEWAKWTWNPVTGCLHECPYCYAKDISMRYYNHFKPEFHEKRLEAPQNTKIPEKRINESGIHNVFVCSMADLFGEWVPIEWINKVFDSIEKNPQWKYLFLTKNPTRYLDLDIPDNTWIGSTADTQLRMNNILDVFSKIKKKSNQILFISCEPLQEQIIIPKDIEIPFNWLIIGGKSVNGNRSPDQPQWGWVHSLYMTVKRFNIPVYFKPNLLVRPKEYPDV